MINFKKLKSLKLINRVTSVVNGLRLMLDESIFGFIICFWIIMTMYKMRRLMVNVVLLVKNMYIIYGIKIVFVFKYGSKFIIFVIIVIVMVYGMCNIKSLISIMIVVIDMSVSCVFIKLNKVFFKLIKIVFL